MSKSFVPVSLVVLALISACNDKNQKAAEATAAYFPIKPFLLQQLKAIDSLQLPTTRYFHGYNHSDTSAIGIAESKTLAAPFLQEDITLPPLKERYTETSFADQSIPSITFTYQTQDSNLVLKRADVVLKPDPVLSDKVRSIYMERLYQLGDSLILEKLFWKADHYYQIIRSAQKGDGAPQISQLKVVWDPSE